MAFKEKRYVRGSSWQWYDICARVSVAAGNVRKVPDIFPQCQVSYATPLSSMHCSNWSEFRAPNVTVHKRCKNKSLLAYLICFFSICNRGNFALLHDVSVHTFICEIDFFNYYRHFHEIWTINSPCSAFFTVVICRAHNIWFPQDVMLLLLYKTKSQKITLKSPNNDPL